MSTLADPSQEQYFLTSPDKLQILVEAAGITPEDRVVELGAGVGTVARRTPPSAQLTVVELDERLIPWLRRNVPHADVLNSDGVDLVRTKALTFDVLLCNLPTHVTESVIAVLPDLTFRTAVLSVGTFDGLNRLSGQLRYEILAHIEGDDFTPPQPGRSTLVRVQHEQRNP
jgi:16S rRNA A1518/A1519 N6-dimethyltransferase RsmA/KsgA/DIM1 with predicted DNA glycosylase/AP lyase activity